MQITIWEPSSADRKNAPVTVGYPFAKGRFLDTMSLSLCERGNELPLSYTITSRWDDGSVRWALLDFQTDLRGNEKKRFDLSVTDDPKNVGEIPDPVTVTETKDGILVENGPLSLRFVKGGNMPFEYASINGDRIFSGFSFTAEEKGKNYTARAVSQKAEYNTKHRAVIRSDGYYIADGGVILNLTVRTYIYAGLPYIKLYHTIENLTGRDIYLDSLSAEFFPIRKGSVRISGNGLNTILYGDKDKPIELIAETEPIPETRYCASALTPHIGRAASRLDEIEGTTESKSGRMILKIGEDEQELERESEAGRLLIYAASVKNGKNALLVRNFCKQAPKRLHGTKDSFGADLYYDFTREGVPLQFWRGTAKTHELVLSFDSPDEDAAYKKLMLSFEEPVIPLYGEDSVLQRSGVCGPLLDYEPDKYPWIEYLFRRLYEDWYIKGPSAGALRGSTFMDFGDTWNPDRGGQWQNNEMDLGWAMLVNMLRTGYPKYFYDAEAILFHQMDVDTHFESEDPSWVGAQRYHQVRHGAFSPPLPCHQWSEGLLLYYFYTGYERAREIALARADYFVDLVERGGHRIKQIERVQGWPLVMLTYTNDCFPDERYADACEKILDWLEEWIAEDGDTVYQYMWKISDGSGCTSLGRGVIGHALAYYHRVTGSKRAKRLFMTVMEKMPDILLSGEGFAQKTSLLRRSYYSPEADFLLEALMTMYEFTGDEKWKTRAIRNFKLSVIQRSPLFSAKSGVAGGFCEIFRFWIPYLWYADRYDCLTDLTIV